MECTPTCSRKCLFLRAAFSWHRRFTDPETCIFWGRSSLRKVQSTVDITPMADTRGIKITPIAIEESPNLLGKWLGMTWIRSKLIYISLSLYTILWKKCQIILINPHIFIQNSILKTFHSFFDKPLITSTYHSESYYSYCWVWYILRPRHFSSHLFRFTMTWQIPLTLELTIQCLLGLTKCYMYLVTT